MFWRYDEYQVRASRLGAEKTTISIEFKYYSTQKACYRIKWVLMQIN